MLTRELEAIHAGHVLLALNRPHDVITVLTPYVEDASRQQRHGRLLQSLVVVGVSAARVGPKRGGNGYAGACAGIGRT